MKLISILLESLPGGYPEVELDPFNDLEREYAGEGFHIVDKKVQGIQGTGRIGAVALRNIDGVDNVVNGIFIEPEFRGKSYAVPTYVKLADKLGSVCSGEFREDGNKTSFVSSEASNVWKRLNSLFKIEKVPIQGDKFRYCLKKENI